MRLYDHPASANCMKVRILLRQLEIPFETVTVDLFTGETKRPEHLARNPDGRVPVLELDSGELIPESGAILLHLADGTPYLPPPGLARTRVHQWLMFEQNQVEANAAVARFLALTGRAETAPEVFADRRERGRAAVATVARGLADGRPFITGDDYTVADIALYAYVHCAGDAGVDLLEHPKILSWLERVEATPRFVNDLAPIPSP
ncbi:MAG TPA: glutathione S-transferase family protein [Solirubrobacter sp.]|nr:glutathione S-transferase family protein [Solirubrobacter sp.]